LSLASYFAFLGLLLGLHKAGFSPCFLFGSSPGHATLGTLGFREQMDVVAVGGVVVWVEN
jgi:hypothetical protein